jgi:Resolvase, N terminal domain
VKYGYARASTDGQSIDTQVRQLKAAGARQVFREVRRVLARLNAGDVLMVTRLDRLARSRRDLLNTLAAIASKGAGFRSLGDTWADTTTPHGRLMLTVLGASPGRRAYGLLFARSTPVTGRQVGRPALGYGNGPMHRSNSPLVTPGTY